MSFRPTTLERAYQLAEGGTCRSVSDIKARLSEEGFMDVHDQLHGPSTSRALRERCQVSYVEVETAVETGR